MRRLLLLLLVTTACAAPSTGAPVAVDVRMPVPAGAQEVVVVRHTDGDTLSVRAVHAGIPLRSTARTKVRLLEIDTPETVKPGTPVQCWGPQSSTRLAQLAPVGAHLLVAADRDLLDRYGRTLLYLWTRTGASINLALVEEGYARADLVRPNDQWIRVIDAAEARARAARLGRWGHCP